MRTNVLMLSTTNPNTSLRCWQAAAAAAERAEAKQAARTRKRGRVAQRPQGVARIDLYTVWATDSPDPRAQPPGAAGQADQNVAPPRAGGAGPSRLATGSSEALPGMPATLEILHCCPVLHC